MSWWQKSLTQCLFLIQWSSVCLNIANDRTDKCVYSRKKTLINTLIIRWWCVSFASSVKINITIRYRSQTLEKFDGFGEEQFGNIQYFQKLNVRDTMMLRQNISWCVHTDLMVISIWVCEMVDSHYLNDKRKVFKSNWTGSFTLIKFGKAVWDVLLVVASLLPRRPSWLSTALSSHLQLGKPLCGQHEDRIYQ